MAIWLLPPVTWHHAAGPTEGAQQVLVVRLIQKGMRLVICNPSPDRWTPAGFLTAWLCPAFDLLWSLAPLQLTNLAECEMPGQEQDAQSKDWKAVREHWWEIRFCKTLLLSMDGVTFKLYPKMSSTTLQARASD